MNARQRILHHYHNRSVPVQHYPSKRRDRRGLLMFCFFLVVIVSLCFAVECIGALI